MLGTQPPRDADTSPPRLNTLAAAAAEMVWAVALAATRVAVVSTAHSLALWSQMLRAPALYAPLGPWSIARGPFLPGPKAAAAPAEAPAQDAAPAAAPMGGPAFASYRSSGGHAAAQVTKPH
jgi:hypothetical protein